MARGLGQVGQSNFQLELRRMGDSSDYTRFKKGDRVNALEWPFAGISFDAFAVSIKRDDILLDVLHHYQ